MSSYYIDEGAYKPQKPGLTLSPSSIDTMEKCPRQYFLQYIEKIKVKDEKPANTFGKIMHLIAENYKGGGGEEIKGLAKCFQTNEKLRAKYWDKLDDEYKSKIPQALKNLHYYLTKRYPLAENFKHEECLDVVDFDKIGETNIHLQGKLDGLYELAGSVFVIDFKSGKKTKDHSGQLGFYLFLIEKLRAGWLKSRPVIGEVVNICLENGTVGEAAIEHHKLEEYDSSVAEKRVKKAIATLKANGITVDDKEKYVKKTSPLCNWCKFKSAGHCDGVSKKTCERDFDILVE